MAATDVLTTAPATRSCWRWPKRVALGLLVLLLLGGGYISLIFYLAGKEWREAAAEADWLDPGWRWEDLEANRAAVPDERNAALCVRVAHDALPDPWPAWRDGPSAADAAFAKSLGELTPTAALTPQQVETLAAALAAAKPALAEARRLKDLPQGRYPADQDDLLAWGPYVLVARRVTTLLAYDVLLREKAGDADGALESCRGTVNVARSFGDEPDCFSQRARLVLRGDCCRRIERTLAQGRPSEAGLAALQGLLEEEEAQPLFLIGARGLRAQVDRLLEASATGDGPRGDLPRWAAIGHAAGARPAALRLTTRVVEIAKLPVEEQGEELSRRGLPPIEEVPLLARPHVFPRLQKMTADLSRGQVGTQAELRCTVVALAAERYRRARGVWPAVLADLAPAYLRAVPLDPFDGRPVRYRRLADGVVIYCLGPDGKDDGGRLDRRKPGAPGTDLGLRLWDADRRSRFSPDPVEEQPQDER
jgi:hypothetical protein